ncbi:calcium uptake protein 2, mitochondrial-like [Corticium candelabrum]|uniref:calcium uptake protein 2, mitochondrial-like n=1 Tax=Corticium candelabrum TaxID=121492 RepID=UPI002E26F700|nr:calcium uptake protein 2, mitochondrial-like [Corticium candelabrum]
MAFRSTRFVSLLKTATSVIRSRSLRLHESVSKHGPVIFASIATATTVVSFSFCVSREKSVRLSFLIPRVNASDGREASDGTKRRRSYRETRFREFASCEFRGERFMTPRDFLESLANEEPAARIGVRKLDEEQVELMLKQTPPLKQKSSDLFRKIYENGLVSYPEYLFLITALTKPRRQFQIAFLMFDQDGNGIVDKDEFQAIQRVVSKDGAHKNEHFVRTSLLVHFFGLKGHGKLDYPSFANFIDNLQEEVLFMQFQEVSHGLPKLSEVQFAQLLIQDSRLKDDEKRDYLSKAKQRVQTNSGITFPQFLEFNDFLNDLDDFIVALRLYTFAKQPVTQEEFQRAAKASMGSYLDPHVVNVVFEIFDNDGDGRLSQEEFIEVMQGRVRRKFKSRDTAIVKDWSSFKVCLRNEMKGE